MLVAILSTNMRFIYFNNRKLLLTNFLLQKFLFNNNLIFLKFLDRIISKLLF